MTDHRFLLAGFGGQGVLFFGKVIATAGLLSGKEVSWLPSYGPEMRGGTCNCGVCLSDAPIGSPLVAEPTALVAMNLPSLQRFIDVVEPGGLVLYDSSMIAEPPARTDVTVLALPASRMAVGEGLMGLANMILLGRLFAEMGFCAPEQLDKGLVKSVPARKAELLELNRKAIKLGMESK